MDSQILTQCHVAISLIGIVSGLIVLWGLLKSDRMPATTAIFLATTILTSVTGFIFFQRDHVLPSHVVGVVALLILIPTVFALYGRRLLGVWRVVYVIGAVVSLYLNVFVLVAQLFLHVPTLHALAPNGNEPAFAIAQGIVLLVFIVFGVLAVKRFHPVFGVMSRAGAPSASSRR